MLCNFWWEADCFDGKICERNGNKKREIFAVEIKLIIASPGKGNKNKYVNEPNWTSATVG